MQAAGVLGALVIHGEVGEFTVAGSAVDATRGGTHAPAVGPQQAAVVIGIEVITEAGFLRGHDDVLAVGHGDQDGRGREVEVRTYRREAAFVIRVAAQRGLAAPTPDVGFQHLVYPA